MATKIQVRRDIAANWTSTNPTLSEGEIGFETDTNKVKIGTGIADWSTLDYFGGTGGGGGGAVDSVNGQTGVVVLTTNNVSDYTNKRYCTDAQKTVIGNTSGTNSGNQVGDGTTITGVGSVADPFVSVMPYHNHQAGLESDPTITEGTGTISVNSVVGWFYTDSSLDTTVEHTIASSGTLTPSDEPTRNYLCADRDTDSWVILTSLPVASDIRYIPTAVIIKRSGSNSLHVQKFRESAHGDTENIFQCDLRCERYSLEEGALSTIACADTTLAITGSGGNVWVARRYKYVISAITTATRQFQCEYNTGAWVVNPTSHTSPVVNNSQYQGASSFSTLTDTYWTINWIYRGIEDQDHLYTILGTSEYPTLVLAQSAGTPSSIPDIIQDHAVLIGRVIIQKGTTTAITVESAFKTVFAASSAVSDHGSLTGLGDDDHSQYHNDARGDARYTLKNVTITGGTNTKITYDSKGLVTSATAATTVDIADSTNKRYVTDANLTVIGNTSGSNSGDSATPAETTSTIGTMISGATLKATPVDADNLGYSDSAASNILKKFTFANLKTYLNSYYTNNAGTVTSVTAGNGMTQSGTSTINPTLDVVSHAGSAGTIGTINIGVDAIGVSLGTTATTACSGADSRLSDARTPTAHSQAETTITFTDLTTGNASTTSHGYTPKAVAPVASSLTVLGIANAETVFANKPILDTTSTPSTQAYGDAAVIGTSLAAAHSDHKHAMPATVKDTTTITGLLKGNGTTVSAASAGTDYAAASHNQAETTITFTDITTGNASISNHGFLPKLGGGTTNFLRADGTWAAAGGSSSDATLSFSDITTNNASTSMHGFFPKLPTSTGKFLKDDMTWATIAGGGDLLASNNLSDVVSKQTSINNISQVSTATNEYVLTKDTGSGNALWKALPAGGSGDVVGPASATADTVAIWNGTTGKLLKDSGPATSNIALLGSSNTFTGLQTAGTLVATAGQGFSNMVVLTTGTSASWSLPAALQVTGAKFKVTCVGGGGGGGGSSTTAGQVGGGGASGGVGTKIFTYVAGQNTMTYSVGAAGIASATNAAGGTGGASNVIYNSVTYIASGGVGGPSSTAAAGAAGGACTGWDLNLPGNYGTPSGTMASTNNLVGNGASTPLGYGSGGQEVFTSAGGNGLTGQGYGSGGSGGKSGTGTTARTGAAGGGGLIIIEY